MKNWHDRRKTSVKTPEEECNLLINNTSDDMNKLKTILEKELTA